MRDAHHVVHDDQGPDRHCWATVGGYTDCGAPATSDVGLCDKHLAELRGDTPRDTIGLQDEVGEDVVCVVITVCIPSEFRQPLANRQGGV